MTKRILIPALVALASASAWGGSGYVKSEFGEHVVSCDFRYNIGGNLQTKIGENAGRQLTDQAKLDAGVTLSNLVVDAGYAPAVDVVDLMTYIGTVTNRLSADGAGVYSHSQTNANGGGLTFRLQATLVTNTISYTLNNGYFPDGVDVPDRYTVESPAITLPLPLRTGWVFDGWHGVVEDAIVETIPAGSLSNRTYVANWRAATYPVTLNLNGGAITVGGEQVAITPYETNYTFGVGFALPSPVKVGSSFGGWYAYADFSGNAVQQIGTTETGAKELWAKFTPVTYTITLDNKGADVSGQVSVDVQYQQIPLALAAVPRKSGYEFGGYFSEPGGNGTQYYNEDGSAYGHAWNVAASGWLYAFWIAHAYTISFDGGTAGAGSTVEGTMPGIALAYGMETNLPPVAFTCDSYVFAGWKTNVDAGVVFADGAAISNLTTVAGGAVTMTATWSAGSYFIAFDANGGEGAMDVQEFEFDKGDALSSNNFTRAGHDFAGWALNASATVADVEYADGQVVTNISAAVDSTNTLYAVWKAEEYEVTLDANDGYFQPGTMVTNAIVTFGESYNLPVPVNVDPQWLFAGWRYIDPVTGTTNALPAQVPPKSDNITNLVARWADGLATALNASGTDLEYETGGRQLFSGQWTTVDMRWMPAEREGTNVAEGVAVFERASYTYIRTTLPGPGVLTFNWRINAPAGTKYTETFEQSSRDYYGGNWLTFYATNISEKALVRLVSGSDDAGAWSDSDWQTVSITNTAGPLLVEWRFEFLTETDDWTGGNWYGGGTGWVDNVTWTPEGGSGSGKQDYDMSGAQWTAAQFTYDGTEKSVSIEGLPEGVEVESYTDNIGTNAGDHVAHATFRYDVVNYNPPLFADWNWTIEKKSITNATITLAQDSLIYSGSEQTQIVERVEIDGLDATFDVSDNVATEAGAYTLTVTGNGNFTGSTTANWVIGTGGIVEQATPYDAAYDGAGHGITVDVASPSGAIVKYSRAQEGPYGDDEILFTNVTDGAVAVWYTVEAANHATVTNSGTVNITARTLTSDMVSVEEVAYVYDGTAKEPQVTVVDGSPSIITADDYDVSYANNVNAGEATVTVSGKRNYTGSVEKTFIIRSAEAVKLEEVFEGIGEVTADGAGGWKVTVTNDTDSSNLPIELPDNLGSVTLDLAGRDLVGQADPAISIAADIGDGEPTVLTVVTTGGDATVKGGDGASAIVVADGVRDGVLINVGEGVTVESGGDDIPAIDGKIGTNSGTLVPPMPETLQVGTYFKMTLADLGCAVPTNGTPYSVVAKGLPAGLKLKYNAAVKNKKGKVTKKAKVEWWIEGVPTVALDYATNPAYLVITANGKTTTEPLFMEVLAQDVTDLGEFPLGTSWNAQDPLYLPGVAKGWTVSGLPASLKYASKLLTTKKKSGKKTIVTTNALPYTVYGKTTKAGLFTITAKKKVSSYYETKKYRMLVTPHDVDTTFFSEDLTNLVTMAYVPFEWGLTNDVAAAEGGNVLKVTGLPAGLTFAAKDTYAYTNAKKKTGKYLKQKGQTIVGKPTKPGTYAVTFSKTVTIRKKKVSKTAQILWKVVANDAELSLGFNTAGGVIESGTVGLKYGDLMAFTATSNATVTASGLPKGITLANNGDGDYAFKGFTTKAGTYLVTVKATLNGKTVTQRVALKVDTLPAWAKGTYNGVVTGTGNGEPGTDATNGLATVTVSAAGKVSGKFQEFGTNWTLSAACYTDGRARSPSGPQSQASDMCPYQAFECTNVVAKYSYKVKSGKKTVTKSLTRTFTLVVSQGVFGGVASLTQTGGSPSLATEIYAWQNLWGSTYKAVGKKLFYTSKKKQYKTFTFDVYTNDVGAVTFIKKGDDVDKTGLTYFINLSLKVTTAGAVTATLTFDTGKKKKGKAVYYKPTCSTVVIPTSAADADPFTGEAVLYFAPSSANNFPGYSGCVDLP
ncbi:MAG: InlB B-repeat-containing protein [Kiritimatiellae bacterium]|nr:InlB B-repeat-containing protein [Kiritimatiellia bacterium]